MFVLIDVFNISCFQIVLDHILKVQRIFYVLITNAGFKLING